MTAEDPTGTVEPEPRRLRQRVGNVEVGQRGHDLVRAARDLLRPKWTGDAARCAVWAAVRSGPMTCV